MFLSAVSELMVGKRRNVLLLRIATRNTAESPAFDVCFFLIIAASETSPKA